MKVSDSQAFLAALYADQHQGFAFLAGSALGWKGPGEAFNLSDRRSIEAMASRAVELGDVRATVATFKTPRSRRTPNVLSAGAAMLDCDGRSWHRFAGLRASIEVASGGKTNGERHVHAVWLLADPVGAGELAELQCRLRDSLGGDPNWNASAIELVRIPGTEHRKSDRLRRVELIRCEPERVYSPARLRECFSRSARAIPKPEPILPANDLPADPGRHIATACKSALARVRRGDESREPAGFSLAVLARRQGASQEQATALLLDHYWLPAQSIPRDHAYYESELRGSIRRAFEGSAPARSIARGIARRGDQCSVKRQRFDPAEVRSWMRDVLADPRLSAYEREVAKEIARRMLGAGSLIVTASVRSLALALSCRPATIVHALNGTKRYPGLHGRWLRKARRGPEGAQRWTPRRAKEREGKQRANTRSNKPNTGDRGSFSPANCYAVYLPSHDAFAFRALGQSIRSTLSVLAGFDRPVSVADFAASSYLHLSERTLSRHLRLVASLGLASQSGSQFQAELGDLDRKLDRIAALYGTIGLRERLRRRFSWERRDDQKRRQAYGKRCAAERERRRAARHRRSRFGVHLPAVPPHYDLPNKERIAA